MAARPQVTLLAVGTLRERFWQDAIAEYTKRLTGYTSRFQIVEVAESTPDKEGERLLAKLGERDYVVVCDVGGALLTSEALAERIEQVCTEGFSHLVFVVGGSDGLSDAVRARGNCALSFGRLTYPHQLLRVMLAEQLFRAFKINRGEAYHK